MMRRIFALGKQAVCRELFKDSFVSSFLLTVHSSFVQSDPMETGTSPPLCRYLASFKLKIVNYV